MKTLFKALTAVALLGAGMSTAVAGDTTWTFNHGLKADTNTYGNTLTAKADDDSSSVGITAWTGTQSGTISSSIAWANSSGLLAYSRAGEKDYWGQREGDHHTIDNSRGTDMLLFSFNNAVQLSKIELGYVDNDSDVTIAAFASLPVLSGNTWANIASQAIFSTDFSDVGTNVASLADDIQEAQYWLIGAYNNVFSNKGWSGHNDSFKLLALTTTHNADEEPPVDVPAPGTAILLTLGVGLIALRRRQK